MLKSRNEIEKKLRELSPELKRNFRVARIGIFGSFARDTASSESDVDLLIQFDGPIGWEIIDLKDFLESELSRKVDIVTEKALKPQYKVSVMQEVQFV